MIDKERDGSKTVIVRGKQFSKRAGEDSRDCGLWEVFLHLAAMGTLDRREQVGGKEVK